MSGFTENKDITIDDKEFKDEIHAIEWGKLEHLNSSQTDCLKLFLEQCDKNNLEIAKFSVESNENGALRFLRARQFDLEKSLQLLVDCVNRLYEGDAMLWASRDKDECGNCDIDALKNWYPHCIKGMDKLGRPILWEHSGGINPAVVLSMTTRENLLKYHWWSMEKHLDEAFTNCAKISEENKSELPQNISTVGIIDLNGFGMAHCTAKMLDQVKGLVAVDNICYPELLGKMFVLNAPWLAVTSWNIVKSWLDPRTIAKIEILGAVTPEVTNRLLEFITSENLPKQYGGTGDNLYEKKDNCDFISVPRNGKISKSFVVGANKCFNIDNYVSEGQIDIAISYKKNSSVVELPGKSIVPPASGDISTRLFLKYPSESEERTFTITWSNTSKWYARQLVYVLSTSDSK